MKPIFWLALLVGIAAATGAGAREQKERLLYNVMYGGLHVADVVVTIEQGIQSYDASLNMRTRGMLEWFQDFRADMKAEGRFDTGHPAPQLFTRSWRSPEVASNMSMRFAPARVEERFFHPITNDVIKPEDLPWNSRRKPFPVVPEKLQSGAVDPITAFIAARRQFQTSTATNVRVPIYDGRRRYDIVSTLGKPRTVTINDQTRTLTPVTSRLEPVFGFEDEGAERMRSSTGTMLLSNDERFIPVQIVLGNDMFSAVMNLTAECNTDPAPCDAI